MWHDKKRRKVRLVGRPLTSIDPTTFGAPEDGSAGGNGYEFNPVEVYVHPIASLEGCFHAPIPCHAGRVGFELVELGEWRNRTHVAKGCHVHQVRGSSTKEGLTVVGLREFREEVVPELFWFSTVLFYALSGDDAPHDWETGPRIQSLRKEPELLNF